MKKIIWLFVFSLLLGCSPQYNVEFKEYKSLRPEWLKKGLLEGHKAKDSIYSILTFTNGFNGEELLVLNQQDTIFWGDLKSDQSMGLANAFRVNNTKPLKIIINGTVIKLKKENVSEYKFVYLGKNFYGKYPYTVTYSKTPRNFR